MFYKELYRVVANDQGILHKYDDDSLIIDPSKIITGDGYPKLVGRLHNHLLVLSH